MRVLIPLCKANILRSVLELVERFGPLDKRTNLWCWDETLNQDVKSALVHSGLLDFDDSVVDSVVDFLDDFIRAAAGVKDHSDEVILAILLTAGTLSTKVDLERFVSCRIRLALKELGRYYPAVNCLYEALKVFRASGITIEAENVCLEALICVVRCSANDF